MPCHICGARQNDPTRGADPWKRGVRHDRQVQICPDCQLVHDWKADLDRCGRCRSTFLLCRLGEIECHSCGHVRPQTPPAAPAPAEPDTALTNEVEQALSRALSGLSRLPTPRAHG
ncbi:hypothetical protein [Marinitenerispora sediminis]|uniref:Uncharacterized protein n=1 Tax=Marinitenerispora sediminis TaxID=1931232 RepID=A0A368TCI7_9ACTN|nr:hypothetical protein [Marinitenerispora sediminis]RCV54608.1 hypothetical protein DEF28_07915 [Marinitenerispora sediminis]RCV59837.1 hypothetical protein DEF23_06150 [Marinitenerispora sediminis]RCV61164.1 hypothetical protein DEF24_04860 [Marinitenerispora sediminis]